MGERLALLTATEVAERLGVSRQTVYRWADAKLLSSVKIGGLVRFHQADVDDFVARGTRDHVERTSA